MRNFITVLFNITKINNGESNAFNYYLKFLRVEKKEKFRFQQEELKIPSKIESIVHLFQPIIDRSNLNQKAKIQQRGKIKRN